MKKVWWSYALLAIALLIAPFVVGQFGSSWVRLLDFCLLYIMLALGLNILPNTTAFVQARGFDVKNGSKTVRRERRQWCVLAWCC